MMEQIWQNYFNTHRDVVLAFRGQPEWWMPAGTQLSTWPCGFVISPSTTVRPWQKVSSVTTITSQLWHICLSTFKGWIVCSSVLFIYNNKPRTIPTREWFHKLEQNHLIQSTNNFMGRKDKQCSEKIFMHSTTWKNTWHYRHSTPLPRSSTQTWKMYVYL
jgi:hypothetical protein